MSGLFWLTNVLDDYYEREFTVDVRLAGIPKNVVITSEIDSVVRVVVRDKGYVIASYMFDDAFRPLFFDFDACTRSDNSGEISTIDIQRLLTLQMYSSSKIVSVKINNLTFSYNHGRHKSSGKVSRYSDSYRRLLSFTNTNSSRQCYCLCCKRYIEQN